MRKEGQDHERLLGLWAESQTRRAGVLQHLIQREEGRVLKLAYSDGVLRHHTAFPRAGDKGVFWWTGFLFA